MFVTCHLSQVNAPRHNSNNRRQAVTRFANPGKIEGRVDFGFGYIPRWFTCLITVNYPGRLLSKFIYFTFCNGIWQMTSWKNKLTFAEPLLFFQTFKKALANAMPNSNYIQTIIVVDVYSLL